MASNQNVPHTYPACIIYALVYMLWLIDSRSEHPVQHIPDCLIDYIDITGEGGSKTDRWQY